MDTTVMHDDGIHPRLTTYQRQILQHMLDHDNRGFVLELSARLNLELERTQVAVNSLLDKGLIKKIEFRQNVHGARQVIYEIVSEDFTRSVIAFGEKVLNDDIERILHKLNLTDVSDESDTLQA